MFQRRRSKQFNTFFYRLLFNESFIDLFAFTFFLATMYTRCFASMVPVFLYMNRYPLWTKFAQVTQEYIMYTQITNVFLAVGGRLFAICFPTSKVTVFAEKMRRWHILLLQVFLPTLIVIPFYAHFNFQYGLKGITNPLLLSTEDMHYDEYIFAVGLAYRVTAFLLCLFGYSLLFREVRKKARRNEINILIHGGCLLVALAAVLSASVCRRFRIGEVHALMRLFFFTTMLWIPCTNIFVSTCVITSLRKRLLHPFAEKTKSSVIFNTKRSQLRRGTM
ncbi:hypothetical protein Y032_0006g2827 [Ancylostoma ceylanicum]|nr:hypothetical protein Y032_0006g2827 [Ancylostoma ceylanicum]